MDGIYLENRKSSISHPVPKARSLITFTPHELYALCKFVRELFFKSLYKILKTKLTFQSQFYYFRTRFRIYKYSASFRILCIFLWVYCSISSPTDGDDHSILIPLPLFPQFQPSLNSHSEVRSRRSLHCCCSCCYSSPS